MMMDKEHQRVKSLLTDTITLLCKNGLKFEDNFLIEATIGITLDSKNVMIVSINETVRSDQLQGADFENQDSRSEQQELFSGLDSSPNARGSIRKRRSYKDRRTTAKKIRTDNTVDCEFHERSEPGMECKADTLVVSDGEEPIQIKKECPDMSSEIGNSFEGEAGTDSQDDKTAFRLSAEMSTESRDAISGEVDWPWIENDSSNSLQNPNPFPTDSSPTYMYHKSFGDTVDRRLSCHYCRETFIDTDAMIQHRALVHSDKTPYKHFCSTCGKAFTCISNLKGHINSHHAQKPFQCTICGNYYGYKHHLRRHIASVHGGRTDIGIPNI